MKNNSINLALGIFWVAVSAAILILYLAGVLRVSLALTIVLCVLTLMVGGMFLGLYFQLRAVAAKLEKQRRQRRGK